MGRPLPALKASGRDTTAMLSQQSLPSDKQPKSPLSLLPTLEPELLTLSNSPHTGSDSEKIPVSVRSPPRRIKNTFSPISIVFIYNLHFSVPLPLCRTQPSNTCQSPVWKRCGDAAKFLWPNWWLIHHEKTGLLQRICAPWSDSLPAAQRQQTVLPKVWFLSNCISRINHWPDLSGSSMDKYLKSCIQETMYKTLH